MAALACTLHGALDLRLEPREPRALGPHDVRVRLGAGGICGSDLHYYQHGRAGAFVIREPLVPGHEASGVVTTIGSEVTRVKPGDKVAIDPSHPCGRCDYCRAGRMNLCRKMVFVGSASVFPHAQGMFAEAFVMPERQLTAVPEGDVTLGEIACAEPLSVGLHAVPARGRRARQARAGHGRRHHRLHVRDRRAPGRCGRGGRRRRGRTGPCRWRAADRRRPRGSAATPTRQGSVMASTSRSKPPGSPPHSATCLVAVQRGGRIVQVGTLPAELPFPANSVMAREPRLRRRLPRQR